MDAERIVQDNHGVVGNDAQNQESGKRLTADVMQRQGRGLVQKMFAASFGEVVSLLMRAPAYKHYSLTDLEWLVLPALTNNQFLVAEARNTGTGLAMPVGVALWATVSDEVDRRLSTNPDHPVRLKPDEWKSGDNLWLIDAVGPMQVVQGLVSKLRGTVFAGKAFKLRGRDDDGEIVVRVVEG